MTKITDILDYDELLRQVEVGNVTIRLHPDDPQLFIANYTDQVAYKRDWNDVTRLTRGLIWNDNTLEVLARPFPKFFNLGEPEAPKVRPDDVVSYYNKYDGSLGIGYIGPGGRPAIATRGSFSSEQAKLGTKILHDAGLAYLMAEYIEAGLTPLYEICGPDNRIVLNYESNFLAGLGYMNIETGAFSPISPQSISDRISLKELMARPDRKNAEGWVIWLDRHTAIKAKQADYIELHRMVSNLTEKEVWRQLRAGTYEAYSKQLPDELFKLADKWADDLRADFLSKKVGAHLHFNVVARLQSVGGEGYSRKDQALYINKTLKPEYRGLVFSLLDGRDISDSIWKMLEPKGTTYDEPNADQADC